MLLLEDLPKSINSRGGELFKKDFKNFSEKNIFKKPNIFFKILKLNL
jgi:hypothetical protein